MLNFLLRHWKVVAAAIAVLALVELFYRFAHPSPVNSQRVESSQNLTQSATQSVGTMQVGESSSSRRVEASNWQTVTASGSRETRTLIRERFRPDGSLEERETEKIEREASGSISAASSGSSKVITDRVFEASASSILEASASVFGASSSVITINPEPNSVGIGPIVWATTKTQYLGLSYRVVQVKALDLNTSIVFGTNANALPNLDLGTGVFVSKSVSPGLELGAVGMVSLPALGTDFGVGLAYHF
jgi:hypothetical protein